MFEQEKECIKRALLEKPDLNLHEYIKQKLDELYSISIYFLSTNLSYITGTTMLLPIYLASRHVCYSIELINSVIKEIMLDPIHLPYDEYAKKIQEVADNFYKAPCDKTPIYYNDSEWDRFDFHKTFGDNIENLFPPFTYDFYREDNKQIYPNCEIVTLEQVIKSSFNNERYLKTGIKNYFEEIIYNLYDISNYLDSRLDD